MHWEDVQSGTSFSLRHGFLKSLSQHFCTGLNTLCFLYLLQTFFNMWSDIHSKSWCRLLKYTGKSRGISTQGKDMHVYHLWCYNAVGILLTWAIIGQSLSRLKEVFISSVSPLKFAFLLFSFICLSSSLWSHVFVSFCSLVDGTMWPARVNML